MSTTREPRYYNGNQQLTDVYYASIRHVRDQFEDLGPRAKHGQVPVGRLPDGQLAPATRVIFYKLRPSLHRCDARCMNARGHNCECSCGGANHGIDR